MDLATLKKSKGSTQNNKRVGRGEGSGTGCTAGRGHKGQKSRSGAKRRAWFEGGQMPIQRRLPKFGFHQHGKEIYQVVNVSDLEKVAKESEVTPEVLRKAGLVKKANATIKVLGDGEISRKVNLKVHAVSKSARQKIEKQGGTVTLI
jgi:large subunit ribosomal protein L15